MVIHSNAIWTLQCTSNLWMIDRNSSLWIDWQDMPWLFGWFSCHWVDSRWTLTVALHCVWDTKRSWIKAATQEMPVVPERSSLSWVPDFGKRICCRPIEDECLCHVSGTKGCTWSRELSRNLLLLPAICQRVCHLDSAMHQHFFVDWSARYAVSISCRRHPRYLWSRMDKWYQSHPSSYCWYQIEESYRWHQR